MQELGALVILFLAAFLEAWGDSWWNQAIHAETAYSIAIPTMMGVMVLSAYGIMVNLPKWDFGKLIGIYVVFFFLAAQIINKIRFGQNPSVSTIVGGILIATGGYVIYLYR
jgi:prepilin signal peptidase PulO-like enzyme (type II secretory pathway)